jgi:hypothetical protein
MTPFLSESVLEFSLSSTDPNFDCTKACFVGYLEIVSHGKFSACLEVEWEFLCIVDIQIADNCYWISYNTDYLVVVGNLYTVEHFAAVSDVEKGTVVAGILVDIVDNSL